MYWDLWLIVASFGVFWSLEGLPTPIEFTEVKTTARNKAKLRVEITWDPRKYMKGKQEKNIKLIW